MEPLTLLFDEAVGEPLPLPPELLALHGPLRMASRPDRPHVFANFVASVDGIRRPSIRRTAPARRSPAKTRATVRSWGSCARWPTGWSSAPGTCAPRGTTSGPPSASTPSWQRRTRGSAPRSGRAPRRSRSSSPGAATSTSLARSSPARRPRCWSRRPRERRALVPGAPRSAWRVTAPGAGWISLATILEAAGLGPGTLVLVESGPTSTTQFLAEGCVDELFLTRAPVLVGRSSEPRTLALVEGRCFSPGTLRGRLLSVRRGGDLLFLRYAFDRFRAGSVRERS